MPQIRFCKSEDGARIAYSVLGSGPPLVWLPHWAHHLQLDAESPVWRPWVQVLTKTHQLIYFDWRGCGLSDRACKEFSLAMYVADLKAVIGHAGLGACTFFGMACGADVALRYAADHPAGANRLIVYGAKQQGIYASGSSESERQEADARLKLFELGFSTDKLGYARFFSSMHMPQASTQEVSAFENVMRATTSSETAAKLIRSFWQTDLGDVGDRIKCPVLVIHAKRDSIIPFEQGRRLASTLANGRFLAVESNNHIPVQSDPAWRVIVENVEEFLPPASDRSAGLTLLTAREREVLQFVASGHDNGTIAVRLGISEKTVRNHLTRIFDKIGASTRAQAVAFARDADIGRA